MPKPGVAISESGTIVAVLVKGDIPAEIPAQEFDAMRPVDVPGPAVIGAAGRLWAVLTAQHRGRLNGRWSTEVIGEAAAAHALATVGTRRAAALDAMRLSLEAGELGLDATVSGLGLSESEICWYRAWTAAVSDDVAGMIGCLEQLPPDSYLVRVSLLAAKAHRLLSDSSLGLRAADLAEPFEGGSPDASALLAALRPGPTTDPSDLLVQYASRVNDPDGSLTETAAAIVSQQRSRRLPAAELPQLMAFDAYLQGCSGTLVDSSVQFVSLLPLPLVDDLIDRGAITSALAGHPAWPATLSAYLQCRLAPEAAIVPQLREAGFIAELARRAYLADDEADLAALPSGFGAVRHYQALARWRAANGSGDLDGARPQARGLLELVSALRAAALDGVESVVPEPIAADPSCWPLLAQCASLGTLRLPDHIGEAHRAFADWLELRGLQRLLFQSNWSEAISAGQLLADRGQVELTRDEAQNMVAFAEFQLGHDAEALRVLDKALTGHYTTGLIVNASIVAAAQGSEAALPYLSRIVRLESDQDVRAGALARAVTLWLEDRDSTEYPDVLRDLIRLGLTEPQPDDFHRLLLVLTANRDATWLAGASSIAAAGEEQAGALRYFRTRARAKTEGYPDTLEQVASVLVSLRSVSAPPAWVVTEMSDFVDSIDDAIHCTFGEAVYLLSPIKILLAAGLLGPVNELVLPAQGCGHLAVFLAERGIAVSPEVERDLLFNSVRRFREREPDMPEPLRDALAEELGRCVAVSAQALLEVTAKEFDEGMVQWNNLVRQERADYQNYSFYIQKERNLLSNLDTSVERLRGYLPYMRGLTLSDPGKRTRAAITSATEELTAEIIRLQRFLR